MAPEIDDSIDNIGGASPTTAQEAASELSEIDDFLLEVFYDGKKLHS